MHITTTALAALRRPRLLISAARFGLGRYDRAAVLDRVFAGDVPKPGTPCLDMLLAHEAEIEECRRRQSGDYRIADHVEVLAAIMAESQTLHRPEAPGPGPGARAGLTVVAEPAE